MSSSDDNEKDQMATHNLPQQTNDNGLQDVEMTAPAQKQGETIEEEKIKIKLSDICFALHNFPQNIRDQYL